MAALSLQFDLTARREKNLRVLQSVDENVLEIIEDYSHVAVYEFETSVGKWERLDVEGSLFITRSANAPFYSVIVLNKKGPSDFELDLSTIIKLSLQKPYIMLRCTAPEGFITFGIWAHNETELEAIHSIITRIAINKETPMAPQSPQAKASQLLSLLKGKNTACSTPSISSATTTVVTVSELNTTSSASTGTSKSMVLLSALKGGISGSSSTKSTSNVVNTNGNTEKNEENNSNEHSTSGNSTSKSAQLLSILKSPTSTSATKATAAACSNSNSSDNTKTSQVNKKKEGYTESKSVPTTAQTAEEKRAELMMKLIKPRATTVEDLLTDVDIAAKVKAAEQVLVSSSSTVNESLPDSTSTSSLNVSSISANSSNSSNDRGSKQDALMRLMMRAVSVSPTPTPTAPATTTAATAPSTNTSTTARVSPPTATSGLPPRPSDNSNTTTGSGSGANGKSSPAVLFSQSGNSTQRSAEQLAAALRNSANSIRSLHRSPSASPILTGMAGPVPGQVTPVSWASLSNQSNSTTGSNNLHISASTGNLSSTPSTTTGTLGTSSSLRNSAGLTSSASSNNVLSASSGGSASSTAAATTVRTATPLLISPSDLRCRTNATTTTASTR